MPELTRIQEELTSRREGAPNATGESSATAPRITISGHSAKETVLEGMRYLDKEFSNHETSMAKATEDVKKLIERGVDKLNRLSNKMLSVLTSAEDKHLSRKSALQQREQTVLAREQALAAREKELAGRTKAFDAREQQLKDEIKQKLAEGHRKELEARDLTNKKVCQELESRRTSISSRSRPRLRDCKSSRKASARRNWSRR